jgi:hypothetical protein
MAATRKPTTQNSLVQAAIQGLADAVKALKDTTETLQVAVFGYWDKVKNEQVPGLVHRFESLEGKVEQLTHRIEESSAATRTRDRWVFLIGGVALLIPFLSALGVPLHIVGQFVISIFSHTP